MTKILAKLFSVSNVPAAEVALVDEAQIEVTTLQPHELSYTGGGGVPDILA